MTDNQKQEVIKLLIGYYPAGTYHPIPEALFRLARLHGLSLKKAKELLLEVIRQNGWSMCSSSIGAMTLGNVNGMRGEKRILQWYIRTDCYYTHFYILK